MRYCSLFGKQCFKNNLMPSVVNLFDLVDVQRKCGFYDAPSGALLQRFAETVRSSESRSKHASLYFHRDRDGDELVNELGTVLSVFEEYQ